jgi:hypothetical protein
MMILLSLKNFASARRSPALKAFTLMPQKTVSDYLFM